MKKLPILILGLGFGCISHNTHAALDLLLQLGAGAYQARQSQVEEARDRNMSASFFSSGTNKCIQPVGSVSIVDPEQEYWVSNLPSPTRILRKVIDDSKCFTIVDRGMGFSALQRERELASAGDLTNSKSIAQSKIRGADYILVPGIVIENANAGGNAINLAGGAGDLVGNSAEGSLSYKSKMKKAEVILTLMDVRSSEQMLSMTGEAKVSDKQFSFLFAGKTQQAQGSGGVSSWGNTGMDEVLRDAYEDAYKRMIAEIGNKNLISRLDKNSGEILGNTKNTEKKSFLGHLANPKTEAIEKRREKAKQLVSGLFGKDENEQQADQIFTLIRLAQLYQQPDIESSIVIELKKGRNVYALGKEENNMIKVQDELGKMGWISKIHLQEKE